MLRFDSGRVSMEDWGCRQEGGYASDTLHLWSHDFSPCTTSTMNASLGPVSWDRIHRRKRQAFGLRAVAGRSFRCPAVDTIPL